MDYPVLNKAPDVAQATVTHYVDANGNAVAVKTTTPMPVVLQEGVGSITWGAATAVAMTGSSKNLIAANASRKGIIIWNPSGNAAAAFDLSGTAVTLAGGIPLVAGASPTVLTGPDCPVTAITAIGTNGQNLCFSEGT